MSDARERLEPVAWRYRYLHEGKRNHWIVRQSPAYSSEPTEQWVGIEAEPLYAEADLRTVLDALLDEVTDAMIEAGARRFSQCHQYTCYPEAADWECADAAKRIYAAMRAALLERGRSE